MKKFYILLVTFVLMASLGFAKTLKDYYPAQTIGVWCFESKWASKIFGYTGKDNEFSKAYQEVVKCLKERISLDIVKDFSKVGVFFIPGGKGFTAVAVFTGNFNTKNNISLIETALAKTNNQEVKMETLSINGKTVKSMNDGTQSIIFYDDSAILYCYNSSLNDITNNRVSFTKAPEDISNMMDKSDCFLYISKGVVPILGMLRVPPQLLNGVNSLVSYVDDNDYIRTEISLTDTNAANQILSGLKNLVDIYNGYYIGEFEKNKRNLKEKPVAEMSETIISMYTGAKFKDFFDSLEFSVEGKSVVIATKYDAFKIVSGIFGGIINVFMKSPQFNQARSNAKEKACFSNQRVLQGAVEMYNMDNSVMMTTLDINTLVKEKYLKSAPSGTEPGCKYYSVGDLSKDGHISCEKHGSPFER